MSRSAALLTPTAEYMAGSRWIRDHLDELVRTYPNQWIAVFHDQVVGANPDLGIAAAQAEKAAPAADIAYHFIDDGTLIFSALT